MTFLSDTETINNACAEPIIKIRPYRVYYNTKYFKQSAICRF